MKSEDILTIEESGENRINLLSEPEFSEFIEFTEYAKLLFYIRFQVAKFVNLVKN
jgi:hypothetical protein